MGDFDDALAVVLELTSSHEVALVNSINPYRIAGQQTAAWEIIDTLGSAPAVHALPVGTPETSRPTGRDTGRREGAAHVGIPGRGRRADGHR